MGEIRIRKFTFDYFVGTVFTFMFLILLIGHLDLLEEKVVFDTNYHCSKPFFAGEIFGDLVSPLKAKESCSVVSPCDQFYEVECVGELSGYEIPAAFLFKQFLFSRARSVVVETDWFGGAYNLQYAPKFSTVNFMLFTIYCGLLIEASALIFALWRQRSLGKIFRLPIGFSYRQFLSPLTFAVFLALLIVVIQYHVFQVFDHPGTDMSNVSQAFFQSVPGMVFTVVFAPVLEEMLFRGVFLKYFVEKKRAVMGTVLVSLGFASLHIFNEQALGWALYAFFWYFLISVMISWFYIKQQNLWSAIIFHSGFNSTMVAISVAFF